jgi:hypothetical protein
VVQVAQSPARAGLWDVTVSRLTRACHRPLGACLSKLGLNARRPGYIHNICESIGFCNAIEAQAAQHRLSHAGKIVGRQCGVDIFSPADLEGR